MFTTSRASIGFLVVATDAGMHVQVESTIPQEYRFPIRTYIKLLDAIEQQHPDD